jgi:hypothetical protein
MTARDLAAVLVSRLPKHSVRDGVWVNLLDASDDRVCGRCPRCGRALPRGSVGPAFQGSPLGPIGIPHTSQELASACLVDGPRSRDAQDLSLADLIDAAHDLASALSEQGWKHWAKSMERALSVIDTADRAEMVGQTLVLMRHSGPSELQKVPELETLVASLARYWPPQKPRPT